MTMHPVDRLYAALEFGDLMKARDCFTPDAVIWHNFDCKEQGCDEVIVGWEQYVSYFPERSLAAVRRHDIPGGVVQQHMTVVRTQDGERKAWATCIVARIEGERIARLEEYIDGASLLPFPEDAARAAAE